MKNDDKSLKIWWSDLSLAKTAERLQISCKHITRLSNWLEKFAILEFGSDQMFEEVNYLVDPRVDLRGRVG